MDLGYKQIYVKFRFLTKNVNDKLSAICNFFKLRTKLADGAF